MDLGPHAVFIMAAYAATAVVVVHSFNASLLESCGQIIMYFFSGFIFDFVFGAPLPQLDVLLQRVCEPCVRPSSIRLKVVAFARLSIRLSVCWVGR